MTQRPCTICTGCGRCQGTLHDRKMEMKILTASGTEQPVNLYNDRGLRLVTADLGTTTIAMQLHRADGSVEDVYVTGNPQAVYGADVLSRISAAEDRLRALEMQTAVRRSLTEGLMRFQERIGSDEELRLVLTGNTTMIYLCMGWETAELGQAPFRATHLEAADTEIAGVPCHILEGLSAFVGGDIVAGILSSGMLQSKEPVLLIDLGTNGEMVLGCRERLIACSTAAGPAFEGGANAGIWGADMVHLVAELLRSGSMDATGLLQDPYFAEGICVGGMRVSQQMIRSIQLAKAAIAAGIEILLSEYGITRDDVCRVVLAGGFGYYLQPADAACVGLLPQALAKRAVSGGNTALQGALLVGARLLQGETSLSVIPDNVSVEIRNLAQLEGFEELYIENMSFQEL